MSKNIAPMQPPLIFDLKYNGLNSLGNDILMGRIPNITNIDPETQAYLDQLRTIDRTLPKKAQPF
eukprot:14593605-Ditylum_brightwellii.AAC.1